MRWREWARAVRRDALVLWIAARDRRVPWPVRLLALAIAGYAFSPIDLIPDFIPVLGYLDDVIIVPAGIVLVLRLIPGELLVELRDTADRSGTRPVSRAAATAVVAVWLGGLLTLAWWVLFRG